MVQPPVLAGPHLAQVAPQVDIECMVPQTIGTE